MDITQKVGTKYTSLGLLLLDDEDGSLVTAITSQHQLNAASITLDILMRWIRGKGRQPVTWGTLIEVLNVIGLTELASTIESGL